MYKHLYTSTGKMVVKPILSLKTLKSIFNSLFRLFYDFLFFIFSLSFLYWCEIQSTPEKDEELQRNCKYCKGGIRVSEMNRILRGLGLGLTSEEEKGEEREIEGLFEEEEPSLEEIRLAFEVFDANRDGYIDAQELETVLSGLGFITQFGSTAAMIKTFDRDGDGFLDFHDFLNLMELCLNK